MQNLRPSNVKVIFRRPSCGFPIAVASGFIAGTAPVVEMRNNGEQCVHTSICRSYNSSEKPG